MVNATATPHVIVRGAQRQVILLLAPLAVLIIGLCVLAPVDVDYWWHVRTGQYIVETHSLPAQDIFSYAAAGRPWLTHEWLTEVLMYLLQSALGYWAEVLLFGLVGIATWAAVYRTCRLRGAAPGLGATLTLGAFLIAAPAFGIRPQSLTVLCCAVTLLLLTRYLTGERRALWPLPALFALWVNLHGGYVIGIALIGLALAGCLIERLLRSASRPLLPLVFVLILSALATLVNPHGLAAWTYPFSYAGAGNASMQFIAEWQSPDFHDPANLLFAASLVLLILVGLRERSIGASAILWAALLVFLALRSSRHMPLYAVAVAPLLGARLTASVPSLRPDLRHWSAYAALLLPWLVLFAQAGLVAGAIQQGEPPIAQTGRAPIADSKDMPVGGADYIREHGLPGNLLNDYGWGGYLIYHLYPQRIVSMDGRADVYGDALVQRHMSVLSLQPGWRQSLDEQNVQALLIRTSDPLAAVLAGEPDWIEVYRGPVESLFERKAR